MLDPSSSPHKSAMSPAKAPVALGEEGALGTVFCGGPKWRHGQFAGWCRRLVRASGERCKYHVGIPSEECYPWAAASSPVMGQFVPSGPPGSAPSVKEPVGGAMGGSVAVPVADMHGAMEAIAEATGSVEGGARVRE